MLCDLHTGQHACARTTYVSCLRGERDLRNLHTGHGSDASGWPLNFLSIFKISFKNKTHVFMGY